MAAVGRCDQRASIARRRILFLIGFVGVLVRRNLIFVLASHRDHAERRRPGLRRRRRALGPAPTAR